MLDLDNFKQVNDTLGHPVGDRVIADIAGVLRGRMRVTDVVARLGGDEFAVVLPRCDLDEARSVAEAIATAIREHVPTREAVPPITASIGIAMFGAEPRTSYERCSRRPTRRCTRRSGPGATAVAAPSTRVAVRGDS